MTGFFTAIGLPLPLPPSPSCTNLLTLLGPRLAYGSDGDDDRVSTALLRALLEELGRPCLREEHRALLWVTPIATTCTALQLLVQAMAGPRAADAAAALGWLGDTQARLALEAGAAHPDPTVRACSLVALARLGVRGAQLGPWDGEVDDARLWAKIRLGQDVTLPESLAGLACLFDTPPDLDALEELVEEGGSLEQIVIARIVADAAFAQSLSEWLPEQIGRVADTTAWAPAIAACGEEGIEAVVAQCGSEDWRVRLGCAVVLGQVQGPAVEAVRPLLDDEDSDVRREAALALGVPIPEWTSSHRFLERASATPLGRAVAGGEVPVSLLVHGMRRDDPAITQTALFLLCQAHPEALGPALEALLFDDGHDVAIWARQAAAAGLVLLEHIPSSRAVLIRLLLMGAAGPTEGLSEGSLVALACRDSDWTVRVAALGLLDRMGAASRYEDVMASLEASDPDATVRRVAGALRPRRYGAPSQGLAALMVRQPFDEAAHGRGLVQVASADPAAGQALAEAFLQSPDRGLALAAAQILGRRSEDPVARIHQGIALLSSHEWTTREAAAAMLGALPCEATLREEVLEALDAVARDDADEDVRRRAEASAERLRA